MDEENKVFTYSEVSSHNTSEDCWVIINGKVYNVTNYLNEHPGGDDVILGQAGKDASEEFEDVGHGSAARLMLDEFYVGEVDHHSAKQTPVSTTTTVPQTLSMEMKGKSSSSSLPNKFLFILFAIAFMGFGFGIHIFDFSR